MCWWSDVDGGAACPRACFEAVETRTLWRAAHPGHGRTTLLLIQASSGTKLQHRYPGQLRYAAVGATVVEGEGHWCSGVHSQVARGVAPF